jgi:pteridine reductase
MDRLMAERLVHLFGTAAPVALVTGSGAKRVGNAVVRLLATRGYRCVVHAHHSMPAAEATVQEIMAAGGDAIAWQADLTRDEPLHALLDVAWSHFGRLDLLVNAAAIWEAKSLEEATAADARRHLAINTVAVFEACRYAGLKMAAQATGGVIVNLGDWAVVRPYSDYVSYFPSKGAIPTLTRNFAVELAARNPRVRVNAVLPGPVMLPPEMPAQEREQAIAGTLVKREGTPQHVADAVVFLAENDFITGVCLPVDGGRSVYAP